MRRFTACRDCGKQILLLYYPKTGKYAPIEAETAPDGNIAWLNDGTYRFANLLDPPDQRHHNHRARCPKGRPAERKPVGRLSLKPA